MRSPFVFGILVWYFLAAEGAEAFRFTQLVPRNETGEIPPGCTLAEELAFPHGSRVQVVECPGAAAAATSARDPDAEARLTGEQAYNWGADRVDQDALPLDGHHSHDPEAAKRVFVYVADTGINAAHEDFAPGQVETLYNGYEDTEPPDDLYAEHGHGTMCAGLIAGQNSGALPGAKVFNVKVLSHTGSGFVLLILRGLQRVAEHAAKHPEKIHIVNLSLTTGFVHDTLNEVVNALFLEEGVLSVAAAGNARWDACGVSPASAEHALAVGATDRADALAYFTNWGRCVGVFAPGVDVVGASRAGGFRSGSGTSFAAPIAAGVLGVHLARGATGIGVMRGVLRGDLPGGSPNLLARWPPKEDRSGGGPTPTDAPTTPEEVANCRCRQYKSKAQCAQANAGDSGCACQWRRKGWRGWICRVQGWW